MRSDEESRVAEFSGQDRRRLAKAMSSASELHLFQRAQAVLRVALTITHIFSFHIELSGI